MERLHAYFSPTKIEDSKKDVLTLTFDAPSSASQMRVQLMELDAEAGGEDDVIALFEGKLEKGQFKGRLIRKATPPYKTPTFKFQFDGDSEVHTLAIPSGRGEKEKGAYEIGAQATRILSLKRGQMGTDDFITKTPVLIHSPEVPTIADQRPVVAFFASSGDAFYKHADAFWEPISDRFLVLSSLEEIVDYLNRGWSDKSKDGMELGPWGQVNIVTHANEEGWTALKLFSDDEAGAFHSVIEEALLDEDAWEQKLKARGIEASSSDRIDHKERREKLKVTGDKLDDKTSIVFRGCNVGRSPQFLKIVRKLFKDKPSVSGPKYIQVYDSESIVTAAQENILYAWEWFQENFYFDIPWPNPPSHPALPKTGTILSRLKKKYPNVASDGEWNSLIAKGRHDSKKPLRYAVALTLFDLKDYKKKLEEFIRARIDEWNSDNEVQRSYEEYAWKVSKPVKDGEAHVIKAVGTKYRIEVRRPLKDAEGKIVVPDLSNPDHYGKEG